MQIKTYYDTLQVSRSASPAVIKAAYRTLSQKYHPDKNPDDVPKALENMKRLNEAYDVLSDERRKASYDQRVREVEAERFGQAQASSSSQAGSRAQNEPPEPPPVRKDRERYRDEQGEEMAARARATATEGARDFSGRSAGDAFRSSGASQAIPNERSQIAALFGVFVLITVGLLFWFISHFDRTEVQPPSQAARTSIYPRCAGNPEMAKCEALEMQLAAESAGAARERAKRLDQERARSMQAVSGKSPPSVKPVEVPAPAARPIQVATAPAPKAEPPFVRRRDSSCPSRVTLRLNSSGYSGLIEVQLRQGHRPGSDLFDRATVTTSGTVVITNVCAGTYFFAFATPDSDQVSTTRYFDVEQGFDGYSNPEITVTYSRSTSGGQRVGSAKRGDL